MNEFSFDIQKDYLGLSISKDISFDSHVLELFNEYSENGGFNCKSISVNKISNGIIVNISFTCLYKNYDYIYTIIDKIIILVEVNLLHAILIASGKTIRQKASAIKLSEEPRINNITVPDEGEVKKINAIIDNCFGYSMHLQSQVIELKAIDLECTLKSSLNLISKPDSEKKSLINQSLLYLTMVENQGKEFGLVPQDFVQKFFLTWSAFNSLYQIYEPSVDKKGLEWYSKKPHVIDYFRLNSLQLSQYIKELATKKLTCRKVEDNCSGELEKALVNADSENISLATLLCIYSIRNTVFHGKIQRNDELSLCRIATTILLPIVHISILKEIKVL